jgi:hypothetical protein
VDASEITSFYAFSTGFTGGVRVGAGDSDADGIAEIVMASGPGTATEIKITYFRNNNFSSVRLLEAAYSERGTS